MTPSVRPLEYVRICRINVIGDTTTRGLWFRFGPILYRSAGGTHGRTCERHPFRAQDAHQGAGIRGGDHPDPGPRHRSQHGDLQPGERRAPEASALRERRPARSAPAVRPSRRTPERGRLGAGALRLPRAGEGIRRTRRVSPDVVRSAQARGTRSGQHRRRVAQLLRCARHPADPRSVIRAGGRRAGC